MKKVSVIIPVYNVKEYLEECLESVLQQEFSDYEVIAIDDASTDGSGEILDEYEGRYDIIHVYRHEKNRGLSAARNTGLDNATGKYVWFVDSDDMIAPNALEKLYQMAENMQTDIVYFNYDRLDSNRVPKNETAVDSLHGKWRVYSGKELLCLRAKEDIIQSETVWIKLYKAEFLKRKAIRFYEGIIHEDVLFSFLCMMEAERIIITNEIFYYYRKRETSIMAQKTHKSADSNFVILVQIFRYWSTHHFTDEENSALKAFVIKRYYQYRYYDCFGERPEKLEVGGTVEKTLFELIYAVKNERKIVLDEKQIRYIKNAQKVIVFGASHVAADVVDILKENGINIAFVAVTDMRFNPTIFCGIPVETIEHISHCLKKDIVIVLGVLQKNCEDVMRQLEQMGLKCIIPKYIN